MKIERKYARYNTELRARCISEENKKNNWEECTITNVSSEGLRVKFHTCVSFDTGSTINLKIFPLNIETAVNAKGILIWAVTGGEGFSGGIELLENMDKTTLETLSSQGDTERK